MTVEQKPEEKQLVDNHREEMIALIRRINTETGIPNTPPSRTAQELREMQVARGVRPEDNTASRELIRLRDRDYREDEWLIPELLCDVSALAKRYYAESGSDTVDALFVSTLVVRMHITYMGYAETAAILRRRLNRGDLTPAEYNAARNLLDTEILNQ